jgi:glycosyltransferase involved in cell wall biosynthesis
MQIAFLLSENYGFSTWKRLGSLERELLIYKKLAEEGNKIIIFSYHEEDKNEILHKNIKIMTFPFPWLPVSLVLIRQIFFPFYFYKILKKCHSIITNQAHNGGWLAVYAKQITKVKVIARCGYVFGEQMSFQNFKGYKYKKRRWLEKITFKHADLCFVPTQALAKWIVFNYGIQKNNIRIIPNFVDISIFKPFEIEKSFDIICIGRLYNEKRPFVVLEAAKLLKFSVLLIGIGKLKDELLTYAVKNNINLKIIDSVNNSDLPNYLNNAKYFITGSIWEGHPKAIIEAMSCGCVCICPSSPGIRNLLLNGINGFLYDGTAYDIVKTIKIIENDQFLYYHVSKNSRNYCVENYRFDLIYNQYFKNINSL